MSELIKLVGHDNTTIEVSENVGDRVLHNGNYYKYTGELSEGLKVYSFEKKRPVSVGLITSTAIERKFIVNAKTYGKI